MASIKFNNVEVFDSNGKVTASGMPSGSVLQVVSSVKKDTDSGTSSTYETITGTDQNGSGSEFSVVITPKQSGSYFLVNTVIHSGLNGANVTGIGVQRDGTILDSTSGSTMEAMGMTYWNGVTDGVRPHIINYLDKNASASAGTSITYRPVIKRNSSATYYVNRIASDANYTTISTITVMEIAT